MAQATDRLRRYLDDELGECRSEDTERRLGELGTLEAAIGQTQVDAELGVLSALANETCRREHRHRSLRKPSKSAMPSP